MMGPTIADKIFLWQKSMIRVVNKDGASHMPSRSIFSLFVNISVFTYSIQSSSLGSTHYIVTCTGDPFAQLD